MYVWRWLLYTSNKCVQKYMMTNKRCKQVARNSQIDKLLTEFLIEYLYIIYKEMIKIRQESGWVEYDLNYSDCTCVLLLNLYLQRNVKKKFYFFNDSPFFFCSKLKGTQNKSITDKIQIIIIFVVVVRISAQYSVVIYRLHNEIVIM